MTRPFRGVEEALAEADGAVAALRPGIWLGPVLPELGRQGLFGAHPVVSEIKLHYLDRCGPDARPTIGVLVSNRLKPTTWVDPKGRVAGLENPLAAHIENFVARFTGYPPKPPLERAHFAPLGQGWDAPAGSTASRHSTFPLEVVEIPVAPDAPMGVEVCVATWNLPVGEYVAALEPLQPATARAIDARRSSGP